MPPSGHHHAHPIGLGPDRSRSNKDLTGSVELVKPREEQSYKDYFPDLNIGEALAIVRIKDDDVLFSDLVSGSELSSVEESEEERVHIQRRPQAAPHKRLSRSLYRQSHKDCVPLISHDKEGDTFQALSTRPQIHLAINQHDGINTSALPKPSFSRIRSTSRRPSLEDDQSAVEAAFCRPEHHYIRYTEPTESELFGMVEYDMDEQDEAWLEMVNHERQKANLGEISGDLFERIVDRLEKEWFDLVKNLPKSTDGTEHTVPEDITCAICDDAECENSNAIVFCDGCNLAVHQDCYGIPYIPEGQWLCRKCMVSPETPVSCIFCPNEGGAFKQTNTNKWGHLICAIWIPEVGVSNSIYMEPIDNIELVPKSRWKLTCYICRRKHGACIQCENKHCFVAFHVTCARWARLCMRMKSHGSHYDGVVLKAYCDRHTPRDYLLEHPNVSENVLALQKLSHRKKGRPPRDRMRDASNGRSQFLPSTKTARAHYQQYTAGAPIAPEIMLSKIEQLPCMRQATNLRKKSQLVTAISRYWSLKRESRRGAPLLKRLHLEPWTASSSLRQSEKEQAQQASAMMGLRTDLEKVRMLSEQVQKREKLKLEQIRKQKAYLEMILFPMEYIARPVIEQLMAADKKSLFRYPVTLDEAPDYHDIIKQPMDFSSLLERLSAHSYTTLNQVEVDLELIWKNSMQYNRPETPYFKLAQRLQALARTLMVQARHDLKDLVLTSDGFLQADLSSDLFDYSLVPLVSPLWSALSTPQTPFNWKSKRPRTEPPSTPASPLVDRKRKRVRELRMGPVPILSSPPQRLTRHSSRREEVDKTNKVDKADKADKADAQRTVRSAATRHKAPSINDRVLRHQTRRRQPPNVVATRLRTRARRR